MSDDIHKYYESMSANDIYALIAHACEQQNPGHGARLAKHVLGDCAALVTLVGPDVLKVLNTMVGRVLANAVDRSRADPNSTDGTAVFGLPGLSARLPGGNVVFMTWSDKNVMPSDAIKAIGEHTAGCGMKDTFADQFFAGDDSDKPKKRSMDPNAN